MSISELHHLRELYRFAELGRMSASLLHEISNPLSAALINLEVTEPIDPSVRKARQNMQILRRYVEAARQQVRGYCHKANFAINFQIEQIGQVMRPLAKESGVVLKLSRVPANYTLYGDPVKFQQILMNLVKNAIQAYDEVDSAMPLVLVKFKPANDRLIVQVTDWGKGIAPANLLKIFEMFHTTKDLKNNGLGIGLALTKHMVMADFRGTISAVSSKAGGTCFTVELKKFNCSV